MAKEYAIRLSRLGLRAVDGVALTIGNVGSLITMATVADASALPATLAVSPNVSTAQVGIAIWAIAAC
jgi:hypothetical protein